MFFGNKKRVDEDLERIRFANLPKDKQEEELNKIEAQKKEMESIHFEKNDRLALILATFSIVLPFVFVFIAVIAVVVGLFYWIFWYEYVIKNADVIFAFFYFKPFCNISKK